MGGKRLGSHENHQKKNGQKKKNYRAMVRGCWQGVDTWKAPKGGVKPRTMENPNEGKGNPSRRRLWGEKGKGVPPVEHSVKENKRRTRWKPGRRVGGGNGGNLPRGDGKRRGDGVGGGKWVPNYGTPAVLFPCPPEER